MSIAFEIQLVAVLVSVACSLAGLFLVLRRLALMSDAISHTVLLGIVLGLTNVVRPGKRKGEKQKPA